jgi:hypothetical protein
MKKRHFLQFFLFLAVLVGLSACGSSSDDDGVSSGTVRLALTDAVDHNYAAVVISIKEIRAVPAGEEGKSVESLPLIVSYQTPLVIEVLDLAYQQQLLGEAVLPAGRYNQLRLVLTANTDPLLPANFVILTDDADAKKIPIDTPSGQQSGLKVVGGFEVQAGEAIAVVLDFDPARSVVETGEEDKRIFKPTGIRVVQAEDVLATYGAITGKVAQAGNQLPVTTATVYAYPKGATTPIATTSVSEGGSFRLLLPPGEYELKVTAKGFASFSLPGTLVVINQQDQDAGIVLLQALTP